jgi:hypothetical protein
MLDENIPFLLYAIGLALTTFILVIGWWDGRTNSQVVQAQTAQTLSPARKAFRRPAALYHRIASKSMPRRSAHAIRSPSPLAAPGLALQSVALEALPDPQFDQPYKPRQKAISMVQRRRALRFRPTNQH